MLFNLYINLGIYCQTKNILLSIPHTTVKQYRYDDTKGA